MKTFHIIAAAAVALAGMTSRAQDLKPQVVIPVPGQSTLILQISDNGRWGLSETGSTTDGDLRPTGGVIFDLTTMQQTPIVHESGLAGISDITDDGRMVVGECNGLPAFYDTDSRTWTQLPVPEGFNLGRINAVTPDGHFGAGYLSSTANQWKAYPVLYDLKELKQIELPNIPIYDMTHMDRDQNVFFGLSADGRYLLGYMSMSYVLDMGKAALCCYVYDRQDDSVDFIGFTPSDTSDWIPDVHDTFFISSPSMSCNGDWVTGFAYMVTQIPGSEFPQEAYHPFRYNVKEKSIEIYTGNDAADVAGYSIGDDGFLYAASPAENPYPTSMFLQGKYFITLDHIFSQVYGLNFKEESGFDNTGKILATSADGLTLIAMPTPDATYLLRLQEPLSNAVGKVRLLADYTVSPAENVQMSKLSSFTITFQRNVAVKGNPSRIKFESEDGSVSYSPVANGGFTADGNKVTVTFRTRSLSPDTKYTLTIPEGMIVMAGDEEIVCDEIRLSYGGRADAPVSLTEAYPADEAVVTYLDLTGNPILLTFDTDLKLGEKAEAYLYRNEDEVPCATMGVLVSDKRALVYPPVRQNLSDGSVYTVVIPEGTLTDISGGGANKEIRLRYIGNYVPELNSDDIYIFNEDCGATDHFLFYEGDHNVPDPVTAGWGFNKDTTPWWYVRSDETSTDMALASHSMYATPGKSDDWMTTVQLYIPDDRCYLTFDAQSYLETTEDRLHIYVYESEDVYSTLTSEIVGKMRADGTLVFDEQLSPGKSEEGLVDEWTNYTVRLPQYAGKHIYIAFVNENYDQSAIFIDNVKVIHDTPFITSIETPERVVGLDETKIKGTVLIASDLDTFGSIRLRLLDAERSVVSTIEESDLSLSKDKSYSFEFPDALPLQKAIANKYYVSATLDGQTSEISREVRNLTFQPSRKVVLEEYTGSECSNCPLGIRAIENIQELYPGMLIPICVRTYSNDKLGIGMGAYSSFLGMSAAPSGRLNRGYITSPMVSADMDYRFSGVGLTDANGVEPLVWLDYFRQAIAESSDLSVDFVSKLDEATGKINVNAQVKSALNMERTSYNLFAVIVENDLTTYQANGFSSIKDPDLGEWGYGGKYAQSTVYPYNAMDVARGTWGTTFNGTGGLIPADLKADLTYSADISIPLPATVQNPDNCDVIVMVIDAGKGTVVNANVCPVNGKTSDASGVEEVVAAGQTGSVAFSVADGILCVSGDSFDFTATDLSGLTIAAGKGSGLRRYPLNGFKGVLILNGIDADGKSRSAKILVK